MLKQSGMTIIILGLLGGCDGLGYILPHSVQFNAKALETVAERKANLLECKIKAANLVPPNVQVSSTPGYQAPVTCYAGSCSGGWGYGGKVTSTDTNGGIRFQVYNQCTAEKGYQYNSVGINECRPEQVPNGYLNSSTVIHPPTSGSPVSRSCYINNGPQDFENMVFLRPQDQLVPN
jgi:hypothetical protein